MKSNPLPPSSEKQAPFCSARVKEERKEGKGRERKGREKMKEKKGKRKGKERQWVSTAVLPIKDNGDRRKAWIDLVRKTARFCKSQHCVSRSKQKRAKDDLGNLRLND